MTLLLMEPGLLGLTILGLYITVYLGLALIEGVVRRSRNRKGIK